MSFQAGSVTGYLKLNTTGWMTGVGKMDTSLRSITRTFTRFGVAALSSLTLIEREFGRFDKAIRHATSVSETTEEQFRKMSSMALDASVKWNKMATDTAQAFYYLGSAGLTVNEQMQAFNDTIMLSRAMGSELSMTVEGLVDITRSFGLRFADTTHIADQLTKTVISSNQVFEDLDTALSYAGATAAFTNNTLSQTAAALGIMANAGIKGSMAGTVFRRALANLVSPTAQMSNLIYELGLKVYDAEGKMKPFVNILADISDKLVGKSEEYRNMVFKVLFGVRAIGGQIQLFNAGADAIRKYANEINNASGITEKVAGKQMKAFSEILGQLWQEVRRVAIEVGQTMAPAIQKVADNIKARLEVFREYVKVNKEAIVELMKWGTIIGLVTAVGGPLLLLISTITTQIITLSSVIASPFVALIAGLYTFKTLWEKSTSEMKKDVSDLIMKLEAVTHQRIGPAGTMIGLGAAGAAVGSRLGPWGALAGGGIGAIAGGIQAYRNKRAYDMFRYGIQLGRGASGGWDEVKEAPNIMESLGKVMSEASDIMKKDLSDGIASMLEKLKGANPQLAKMLDTIQELIKTFMEAPTSLPENSPIQVILDKIPTGYATPRKPGLWDNMVNNWKNALREMFDKTEGQVQTWKDNFVAALKDVETNWTSTFENMMNEGTNFKDFMEDMFVGILRAFNHMVAQMAANDLLAALTRQSVNGAPSLWADIINPLITRTASSNTALDLPSTEGLTGGEMGMAQKAVPVTINVDNKGTPVNVRTTGQYWNGREYVINVVMDEYNTNPNFRNILRGS